MMPAETTHDKPVLELAAGLLLENRQISYTEIEALLSLEGCETNDTTVENVVAFLSKRFKAERVTRKTSSYPILTWEPYLQLPTTPAHQ